MLTLWDSTENSSPSNGVYQSEIDVYSKKRKLDHIVSAKETPKSPLSNCPAVTPDESTHHAEHARVIIQSELDGNERMNRERQAILKSALEFVNSMARGADSPSDEAPTFDVPHDDCPDIPESIEPTPELMYMLLRGTVIQAFPYQAGKKDQSAERALTSPRSMLNMRQNPPSRPKCRITFIGLIISPTKLYKRWSPSSSAAISPAKSFTSIAYAST